MAKPPRSSDLAAVLQGLLRIGSAAVEVRSQELTRAWATSSVRPAVATGATRLQKTLTTAIQQPKDLKSDVSKTTSEVLARASMVGEGLRAYTTTTTTTTTTQSYPDFQESYTREEDALGDVEGILMQEALSMSNLTPSPDHDTPAGFGKVQEEALNVIDKAMTTREEVNKRIESFETIMNIGVPAGREITAESLESLDRKVEELEYVSHGQDFIGREAPSKDEGRNAFNSTSELSGVSVPSNNPEHLSIEELLMHDAVNSNSEELLSETQKYLYDKAHATTEAVRRNVDDMEQRVMDFEPLLSAGKAESREITEHDLRAIDEKLSDLQDVAFGHDLKIFREVGDHAPVEEIVAGQSDAGTSTLSEPRKLKVESENVLTSEQYSERPEDSTSQVAEAGNEFGTTQVSDMKVPHVLDPRSQVRQATETKVEDVPPISSAESQTSKPATSPETFATSTTTTTEGPEASASAKFDPVAKPDSPKRKPKLLGRKPLAKEKPKSTLADNAQARKVPHSRIGRLVSFGGLAAGLGMGTLAEVTRRSLGLRQGKNGEGGGSLLDSSPFLTEANARRIVDTLCRVRGAALKLGQMLSIQDSAMINPQLQKIFERVRQSADFMPTWQLEEAISNQLGHDWRSKVATFDDRPFAAASIGQVHLATLHDGRPVAMKIQYPGVAEGIESDINNLVSSLKVGNILPEGLFVDSIISVATRELRWECDYVREAECTRRYKELLKAYPEYYVPEVITELCTPQIITTELIAGIPVDKCTDIDQDVRNYISEKVVQVCLMELFQFGFMQTDPNWSNFFYDAETEQLALLDFGACREYSKEFVDTYLNLIQGAAMKDRDSVHKYSLELGFLTGYEAKVMVDAHVDAIMILGEAFQEDRPFDFGDQNITHRIQNLVPVMISHRMCPPPEEIYSLHRKMSGVFLLCTKLNAVVNCHNLFHDIVRDYKFGGNWEGFRAGKL